MKALCILSCLVTSIVLTDAVVALGDKEKPATSDIPKPPTKPKLAKGSPAEQIQALIKQHEQARAVFDKLFHQLKDAGKLEDERERGKLEHLRPANDLYAKLLVQIAEKNPKD